MNYSKKRWRKRDDFLNSHSIEGGKKVLIKPVLALKDQLSSEVGLHALRELKPINGANGVY